jgi:hypothetical protein
MKIAFCFATLVALIIIGITLGNAGLHKIQRDREPS